MGAITQFSAVHLIPEAKVDPDRWNRMPPEEVIFQTVKQIEKRGITVIRVNTAEEALEKIKKRIPPGSSVMNGSSTTLIEIGYQDLQERGNTGWIDLHANITATDDSERREELRRKSVTADYFLSGVNAIAQTGELVSCDRSGSRVGAWPFAADHLILVSGANKIVPTLFDALERVRNYALPLEDARSHRVYGVGSRIGKCVILANEDKEGRIVLILVTEILGY